MPLVCWAASYWIATYTSPTQLSVDFGLFFFIIKNWFYMIFWKLVIPWSRGRAYVPSSFRGVHYVLADFKYPTEVIQGINSLFQLGYLAPHRLFLVYNLPCFQVFCFFVLFFSGQIILLNMQSSFKYGQDHSRSVVLRKSRELPHLSFLFFFPQSHNNGSIWIYLSQNSVTGVKNINFSAFKKITVYCRCRY